jgi:hypothetical protein
MLPFLKKQFHTNKTEKSPDTLKNGIMIQNLNKKTEEIRRNRLAKLNKFE